MLDSLLRMTDQTTLAKVQFKQDEAINRIVSSWPGILDNTRAMQLGFERDRHFDDFIRQFLQE
jgi:hypothetical protein